MTQYTVSASTAKWIDVLRAFSGLCGDVCEILEQTYGETTGDEIMRRDIEPEWQALKSKLANQMVATIEDNMVETVQI